MDHSYTTVHVSAKSTFFKVFSVTHRSKGMLVNYRQLKRLWGGKSLRNAELHVVKELY